MPFSQAGITDVQVAAVGPDLFVSWSTTAAPTPTFQVYVDRRLVWSGRALRCHVPRPTGASGRNVWVEVGAVLPSEAATDFSASLAAPSGRTERATLAWSGGTYLDSTGNDNIGAFLIFASAVPGGSVDFGAPVDRITAYPGGWINDGFGKGGFGAAGFGRAGTSYQWQSSPLSSGAWQFAVVAVDRAGNPQGGPIQATVTIKAAPRPPALGPGGTRLSLSYQGPAAGSTTLSWLASPTPPTTG